jgi:hypothetical protein
MLDDHAAKLFAENINMTVPYYLMASYAYYIEDDPIFSDGFYDGLAKQILDNWDNITHRHRDVLRKDDLEAGSFLGEYPSIIEGALKSLREQLKSVAKPKKQAKKPAPKPKKDTTPKPKKPAPKDTMGAFGNPLFEWDD